MRGPARRQAQRRGAHGQNAFRWNPARPRTFAAQDSLRNEKDPAMSQPMNEMREEIATSGTRLQEDARAELARLRAQVERLMQDRVTPALGSAAQTAEDYARRARHAVEENAGALSATVRDRPLLAIGAAALGGWLIGRLMGGGTTYVVGSDRHHR
jgi:ElaB/YqjD/DUF883 family membrane-anchored ribosome-binding protein